MPMKRIIEDARFLKIKVIEGTGNMACLTNPISQPRSDINPIFILLISNEVSNSQRRSV
jgi:hypothetical protein